MEEREVKRQSPQKHIPVIDVADRSAVEKGEECAETYRKLLREKIEWLKDH